MQQPHLDVFGISGITLFRIKLFFKFVRERILPSDIRDIRVFFGIDFLRWIRFVAICDIVFDNNLLRNVTEYLLCNSFTGISFARII